MRKLKSEDLSWICYRHADGWREHVFPANARHGSKCWCGHVTYRFHARFHRPNFHPESTFLSQFEARSYIGVEPEEGSLEEVIWFLS